MCTYWNLIFFIKIVWTWSHWTLFLHGPVCCTKEDLSSEMYEVLKENNLNIGPLTASNNRNSNFRNCTCSRNTQLRSIHFRGQTNYTIPYCSYHCFTFKRPKKTEHLICRNFEICSTMKKIAICHGGSICIHFGQEGTSYNILLAFR